VGVKWRWYRDETHTRSTTMRPAPSAFRLDAEEIKSSGYIELRDGPHTRRIRREGKSRPLMQKKGQSPLS